MKESNDRQRQEEGCKQRTAVNDTSSTGGAIDPTIVWLRQRQGGKKRGENRETKGNGPVRAHERRQENKHKSETNERKQRSL